MDTNKIYNELMIAHDSFSKTLPQNSQVDYSKNTAIEHEWYNSIGIKIMKAVGIQGGTKEEIKNQLIAISNTSLTDEQKKQLFEIRKHPMYKKMMGENALQMKAELEQILDTKLTSEGLTMVSENGATVSIKAETTLYKELDNHVERLSILASVGKITTQQEQSYQSALDSIYTYYVSQSKGEQIPFRRISDSEYEKIEEEAIDKGISPEERLIEINQDLAYELQENQDKALSVLAEEEAIDWRMGR